jgi:hypothetical protein
MKFMRITDMDKLDDKLDEFLGRDEAYLCECIIDPMDLV